MKNIFILSILGFSLIVSSCTNNSKTTSSDGELVSNTGYQISAHDATMLAVATVIMKHPETVDAFGSVSATILDLSELDITNPEELKTSISEVVNETSLNARMKLWVLGAFDSIVDYYGNRFKDVNFDKTAYKETLQSISRGIESAIELTVRTEKMVEESK